MTAAPAVRAGPAPRTLAASRAAGRRRPCAVRHLLRRLVCNGAREESRRPRQEGSLMTISADGELHQLLCQFIESRRFCAIVNFRELFATLTLTALATLLLCSCSKARPEQGRLAQPVSWEEDIAPLFAAQCNSCHSGPAAPLGYRTTSYLEALGPTAAPVAVAGDAGSLLLRTIDPAGADAVHQPVPGALPKPHESLVERRRS